MRYIATYLLAVLGGNASPSAQDIKNILGKVGIEADDGRLNTVIGELRGKDVEQVISAGLLKLASVPAGGAVAASAAAAAGATEACAAPAAAAVEQKEEEKKADSEESDDDMGFGLFD